MTHEEADKNLREHLGVERKLATLARVSSDLSLTDIGELLEVLAMQIYTKDLMFSSDLEKQIGERWLGWKESNDE